MMDKNVSIYTVYFIFPPWKPCIYVTGAYSLKIVYYYYYYNYFWLEAVYSNLVKRHFKRPKKAKKYHKYIGYNFI